MHALKCMLWYVWFHLCALICLLSGVFLCVCSQCHACVFPDVFMCFLLTYVCSHARAFTCVCYLMFALMFMSFS